MAGVRLIACTLLIPPGIVLAQAFGVHPEGPEVLASAGVGLLIFSGTSMLRRPVLPPVRRLVAAVCTRLLRPFRRVLRMDRQRVVLERLDTFVDLAPQLALETDAQGQIVFLSGGLSERWQRTLAAEGSRARPSHQLIAPEQFQIYSSFLHRLLAGDSPQEAELSLRPEGGCDIPARVRGCAVTDPQTGEVRGVRAVFTDISREVETAADQHRELEQGLLAANRKLTDIIEFLPDATFVIDAESRVVAWNRAMEELTGVPKEEMIGQGDYAYSVPFYGDRVPVLIDHFSDADVGDWRDIYHFVEINRETLYAETFIPFLNEGRGAYLWVTASPLFDSEGRVVGAIESLRDITYRRRAEEALRHSEEQYRRLNEDLEKRVEEGTRELRAMNAALGASEERYRRIVENLREGHIFYSHDTEANFTYVSPSFSDVLGYDSTDEFTVARDEWLAWPENREALEASEKGRLGLKQPPYDVHVRHADGSRRILEILEVPIFGPGREVTSVEGLGRDVTEVRRNMELIRQAQEQLVESRKMAALGTLVAGLSHEVNTPVGIGVTAVSHLAVCTRECLGKYSRGELTRSAFEEFLDSSSQTVELLQTNLNRAADLLQNFKQVAVDQSAGQARDFGLNEYLGDVIRSFRPRLQNTGFTLHHTCEDGLEMHCDPGALYQIIANLVMNSLTHAFDGMLVGEMRLEARRTDRSVQLEYRDNGIGMSRDQLARLYEPFYTTKRGRGGTGLGMHIVYNNVTQVLGGSISCTSRTGRGTRFVIDIPLQAEAAHA